jgi:protein-export membrane protein SecD
MLHFSPWKTAFILLVVFAGVVFASPNLMSEPMREDLPGFLPSSTINLGLDLQGGSHLLLEVDVDKVKEERLEAALDDARSRLRSERIPAGSFAVVNDEVTLRVTREEDADRAEEALEDLSQPVDPALGNIIGGARTLTIARDGTQFRIAVTPEYLEEIRRRTVAQSIEIIRRRIDVLGTTEPTIQRQGRDRVLVQVPGIDDPQRLKDLIGQTAKMTFHMVTSASAADIENAVNGRISPLESLLPMIDPFVYPEGHPQAGEPAPSDDKEYWGQCLTQVNCILVQKRATLSGEDLRSAGQGFHPQRGDPIVNFTFDQNGARVFGRLTSENQGRQFAVVLDGVVITAPRINSPILGGSGYIEGGFTVQSASDLAALLNAGALPAPLTIEEERTVGASLGEDSVNAGRNALLIGFLAVVVFMLVAYGLFGVFANLALFANVALIAGALSGLGATLTLPGIAGIILTIGMAVDANVLIFERIREEAKTGRTPANAIEAGYSRALSAILDANITTLIATVILFQFGSGPVRGFAVTLSIGVVTSVFTAFLFSRLMLATWFKTARPKALPV